MRTSYPKKDKHGASTMSIIETPMRSLIKYFPDLAGLVFNKCIITKTEGLSYEMDYEFLDDAFNHSMEQDCNEDDMCKKSFKYLQDMQDKPYHKNPMSCEYIFCGKRGVWPLLPILFSIHKNTYETFSRLPVMWNHPLMIISKNENAVVNN